MKCVLLLALLAVCSPRVAPHKERSIRLVPPVLYTVRNRLQCPTFELRRFVPFAFGDVFQTIMEKAATSDPRFRFTVEYFNETLGYFTTTINNLEANYTRDRTFWELLRAPNTPISLGISNYKPFPGEHIIFNFTKPSKP